MKPTRRLQLVVDARDKISRWIAQLRPMLRRGDIIIDGGNSLFRDTERRIAVLAADGIYFLGVGISGGEEGALHGPSIMPGGPAEAYDSIDASMTASAALAPDGTPCVSYLGPGGAGHYVKMVHNGIEYGSMSRRWRHATQPGDERSSRRLAGDHRARAQLGASLLRRPSQRAVASESHAGPARLFRRAHL